MKKIDRSEQNRNQDQDQDQDQLPVRPRKLQLHRETLRSLTTDQLLGVAGGASGSQTGACCIGGTI